MDQESQKYLDAILAKEPSGLTNADADFLRARREYLSDEQVAVFASVIEPEETKPTKAQKTAKPTNEE